MKELHEIDYVQQWLEGKITYGQMIAKANKDNNTINGK